MPRFATIDQERRRQLDNPLRLLRPMSLEIQKIMDGFPEPDAVDVVSDDGIDEELKTGAVDGYSSRTTHAEEEKNAMTFQCWCGRSHTFVSVRGALYYKIPTGASFQLDRLPDVILGDSGNYESRPNTTVKPFFLDGCVESLACNYKCGRIYEVIAIDEQVVMKEEWHNDAITRFCSRYACGVRSF